jgi:predicted esterase
VVIPEALPCIHPSIPNNVWYNIGTTVPEPGDPERAYEAVEFGVPERNEKDMKVTMDYFETLIKSEIAAGTPVRGIVFVGYSQGATILMLFLVTRRVAAELCAVISYAGFPPHRCNLYLGCRMRTASSMVGARRPNSSCCTALRTSLSHLWSFKNG